MVKKPKKIKQIKVIYEGQDKSTKLHNFEVEDPNNPDCKMVGPHYSTNKTDAHRSALETKRELERFYKNNWTKWNNLEEY